MPRSCYHSVRVTGGCAGSTASLGGVEKRQIYAHVWHRTHIPKSSKPQRDLLSRLLCPGYIYHQQQHCRPQHNPPRSHPQRTGAGLINSPSHLNAYLFRRHSPHYLQVQSPSTVLPQNSGSSLLKRF
jgi:hypothetical protein